MPKLRFTLRIQRENGKPLRHPREVTGAYFETHNQTTFAWTNEESPAARPLHNSSITLHPNGVGVSGIERDGEKFDFQEWWLIPESPGETESSAEPQAAPAPVAAAAARPVARQPVARAVAPKPEFEPEMPLPAAAGSHPGSRGGGIDGIEWSDGLELGVEAVDIGHQMLVDELNTLMRVANAADAGRRVEAALGRLVEGIVYNLAREESMLERAEYPRLDEHRALHEEFKTAMHGFKLSQAANPDNFDLSELVSLCRWWLDRHVGGEDRDWVPHVLASGAGRDGLLAGGDAADYPDTLDDVDLDDDESELVAFETARIDDLPLEEGLTLASAEFPDEELPPEDEVEEVDLGPTLRGAVAGDTLAGGTDEADDFLGSDIGFEDDEEPSEAGDAWDVKGGAESGGGEPEADDFTMDDLDLVTVEEAEEPAGDAESSDGNTPASGETAVEDDRPIRWKQSMETGIHAVDSDHRVLVELINQLREARTHESKVERENVVGSVLRSLVDYTQYHFAREERVMEAAGYPDLERHMAVHRDLEQVAAELLTSYVSAPDRVNLDFVQDFLKKWLVQHIMKDDFSYVPYCEGRPEVESAAAGVGFLGEGDEDGDEGDLFAQLSEMSGASAQALAEADAAAGISRATPADEVEMYDLAPLSETMLGGADEDDLAETEEADELEDSDILDLAGEGAVEEEIEFDFADEASETEFEETGGTEEGETLEPMSISELEELADVDRLLSEIQALVGDDDET